ncbi:MAG TPA: DNA ligase D [Usitatibacter sp.]|jgi:bifunctional non-homologous end joining protein LigD|nr:DNA ligase D [Usitatibacter sp.]
MAGRLSTYWKKRDFGVTSEPRGEVARAHRSLSYVIQKHAASRLHYDFRLELDGTLVSWAVPKGPSLDPHVRRMAVHVEDHPLSYGSFEGVIPKGQYGAGTVEVWDRGKWTPLEDPREGMRKGRLKFDLEGEKLHGHWMLVRMNNHRDERHEPWLLIKEQDDAARPAAQYDIVQEMPDSVIPAKPVKAKRSSAAGKAPAKRAKAGAPRVKLPLSFSPQLATLVDSPPKAPGWIYEVKFDGYRILARIDGDDVRLFTRNGNNWTSRMKALAAEVAGLGIEGAWLDGEIVVLDAHGNPSFQLLQNAFDSSKTSDIVYFVFDAPYLDGRDLRRLPLLERRALLREAFARTDSSRVRFSEHFEADGAELLASACGRGLEGIIGKRADAAYSSMRSPNWIKLKCTKRQEFVIVGYTDPKGSRTGFGSLLLAVHDRGGELLYAGNVGTGFDDASLATLKAKLTALDTEKMPLAERPKGVKAHWVKPKLVAEVSFGEWTSDGRIRHPVFQGLRTDKSPEAITREAAVEPAPAEKPPRARENPAKGRRRPEGNGAQPALAKSMMRPAGEPSPAKATVRGVAVSHADREIDPASKATKLDLVRYYDAVAPAMLPHLVGRPVALVRGPTGVTGQLFFQKHGDSVRVPGIKELDPSYWPGHLAMLEIDTPRALVAAAQMNVIEFHTWNSTTRAIDKPDRVIFDLDPGEGVDWGMLVEATRLTKEMLDLLGLESFLKTSGGKGLHVVVPLTPKDDYDTVKGFSQAVVVHLARTLPKLFVAKSGASNRLGKIFVDYLRNGNGATTVAAFSARSRPGMGVSVPLAWSELAKLRSASQWNIFNLHERIAKQRGDPWKDYARTRQRLAGAAKKLGA